MNSINNKQNIVMRIFLVNTSKIVIFMFMGLAVMLYSGTTLNAQSCSFTLNMYDSYGDGWNGGHITVFINGVNSGTYSATGYGSTAIVNVPQGSSVEFRYTAGSWESENSYNIQLDGITVYSTSAPPPTGIVYTYSCAIPCAANAPYSAADPCYQIVIADDPWCCDVMWDASCQEAYNICDEYYNTDLVVYPDNYTPNQLVQDILISGCVEAHNVQYTGHNNAIGYFTGGMSTIGLQKGIIMSTGHVSSAHGPNSSGSTSTSFGTAGNALLSNIAGGTTYDAAVLSFNFIPASNEVSFNYVFASEEYPEYAGSSFNDVFAFILNGGPENYNNFNIALLPGTATPVTINNVNDFTNSQYYVINHSGQHHIEYDGFTVPLAAYANVTACATYHITLGIADVADAIYDSAVFLEEGSFISGEFYSVQSYNVWGADVAIMQGCENYLVFERIGTEIPLSEPVPIVISFDGTAVMGTHYSNIPTNLVIPPFETSITVYFDAFITGNTNITTIIINLENGCPCTTSSTQHIIEIHPPFEINPILTNNGPACVGDPVQLQLTPNAQNSSQISVAWSTGDNSVNTVTVNPNVTTTYHVTVTYPCDEIVLSTTVQVFEEAQASFTQLGPYCTGDTPGVLSTTSNNGITGTWSPATINTGGAGTTNYVFTPNPGQCAEGTTMSVTVEQTLTPTFNSFEPYCQGDTPAVLPNTSNNGVSGTWNPSSINTSSAGTSSYTFTPSGGQCATPISINVVVEANQTPVFTQLGPYCVGDVADALPATSNNEIPGTWEPAVISTTSNGTFVYTFTPNPSVCAVNQTMTIVVNPGVDPVFNQLGPYCIGDTPDVLPNTSINGITGSWNPAVISTATAGNHTYTFNPDIGQCAEIYTMNISISDLTLPQFNNPSPYCQGDNPTQLPVTSINGITGTWNPATINTSTAGVFTHTFTPTSGECVTTENMDIVINPNPEVIITETQPVMCYGETAILNVSAVNGTPNYDGVGVFEVIAGNHSFTVTDANMCSGTVTYTVNQPDALNLSASLITDNLCCGDNNAEILVNISGGVVPYSLSWDGGSATTEDNQYNITNLEGGSYNIVLTDANNCTNNASVNISNPPELIVELTTSADMICNTPGNATISATGGTPSYTFLWPANAGGVNQGTATNLSPGIYSVTVRDSNNCEETVSFEIFGTGNISATANVLNHPRCNGDSNGRVRINFAEGTPNFNINWGIGSTVASTNEYTINGLPAGNYNITVTDANGCQQVLNVVLTNPPILSASVTSTTDQTCATPGSAMISASGGTPTYTYLWPPNATGINNNIATGLFEGSYSVTVIDAHDCQAIVNFTINDFSDIVINTTVLSHVSCHGQADAQIAVQIQTGSPEFTISWGYSTITTSSEQHVITNLYAGHIAITVTDKYGCVDENQLIIYEPAPIEASYATINPSCAGMNDGSIEIIVVGGTEPYIYSYNNINTNIPFIEGLFDGLYNIIVYDANECIYDLGTIVLIEDSEDCLEIPNAFSPNGDGINDTWLIKNIEMFPSATISIFNRWGQLLYYARGNEDPWDGTYNGKFVSTGTYVYIINLQNRSESITGTVTVVY